MPRVKHRPSTLEPPQEGLAKAHLDLQRRYDDLLGRNLAAIFRTTIDGRFVECNDAMATMLGYESREELMARPAQEFYFALEDRQLFVEELGREGKLMNYVISLKHKSGRRVEVLENVYVDEEPGGPTTIQGTAFDITPLKQAEKEQQEMLSSYRALVEHIRDGILLIQDGRVCFVNPAAKRLLGVDLDEGALVAGSLDVETILAAIDIARDGNRGAALGPLELVLRSGRELAIYVDPSTHNGRPADQITLQDQKEQRLMYQERSRVQMAEEVNEVLRAEISEHRRTQNALRRSRRFSGILVDSSLDMIIAADPEGRVTEFNPAAVMRFGWEKEEVIGKNSRMLYADPESYDRVQAELEEHGAFAGELLNKDRDGKFFTAFLTASRLYDEEGVLLGSMGVSRDITRMKKDQEDLRASEERYRDLFENATDLIQSVDAEGRFQFVNAAWRSALGYSEEELRTLTIWDIIHPDHRAECEQLFRGLWEGEGDGVIRTVFLSRNGQPVTVEGSSNLRKVEGKGVSTRSIFRDMTKALATQRQVDEHEAKWRALFESSDHMFWTVDPDIKLTSFNQSYSEMIFRLHGKRPELNLRSDKPRKRFATKADHDRWDQRYKGVFGGMPARFETDLMDLAGERVSNEVFLSPVFSDSGEVKEVFGIGHEITDLRLAEDQVKEQSARLLAIFETSANMMIWTLDPDLRITSCNAHFLRSIEAEHGVRLEVGDHFAEAVAERVAGGAADRVLDKYRKAVAGIPQQFEVELIDKNGEPAWIENFLNPIILDGRVEEVSCLAYGITDRKKDQLKILRSLEEKEVLLKEVHHRVKNNLQIVSSIFNLQSAHVGDDERVLGILRDGRDRIASMSFIHESLYQHKDFSSIDFAGYIEGLSRNLMMSYSLTGQVSLETELEATDLVLDQAIPCGLILNELISNALKHAFPGGRSGKIRIVLTQEKGSVRIVISDDGVGVPVTFDPIRDRNLGLELVYTLVDQLDGNISVENHKGLRYLFTFERTK